MGISLGISVYGRDANRVGQRSGTVGAVPSPEECWAELSRLSRELDPPHRMCKHCSGEGA